MTVKEIVKAHLIKNRFDGLCTEACGCFLDNLMPCEGGMENCVPGYEGKDEDGERGVFEEKQGVKKESK
jgi:hypothetical protein